jgi:hypothetical protein
LAWCTTCQSETANANILSASQPRIQRKVQQRPLIDAPETPMRQSMRRSC